jgi:hypothetical protein
MNGRICRQRGIGMVGVLVGLGVAALLLTLGVRLAPPYMQFLTVRSAMNDLSEDADLQGKGRAEVMSKLGRRLEVNSVDDLPAGAFSIEQKDNGRQLVAAYEVRVHLLSNIDAVLVFDHRAPLPRQ